MYKLINTADGSIIGRTETIEWIKKKPSTGCYISAERENEAEGLVFNSTAYNILGKSSINLNEDAIIVRIIKINAGNDIDSTEAALNETNTVLDNIIINMLNE